MNEFIYNVTITLKDWTIKHERIKIINKPLTPKEKAKILKDSKENNKTIVSIDFWKYTYNQNLTALALCSKR